jgi:hypothetical protein
MTVSDITLSQLHDAFEEALGRYDDRIEFKRKAPDETVPTEIDVLFYLPKITSDLSEEDNVTIVVTAGMSTRVMEGPHHFIELVCIFTGGCDKDERKKISEQLAWLSLVPFKQSRYFAPGMVLENFQLYPFEHMPFAAVIDWGLLAPDFLPLIQPPVRLLQLIPLYEKEAQLVDDLGVIAAYTKLQGKGVVFENFKREPVV